MCKSLMNLHIKMRLHLRQGSKDESMRQEQIEGKSCPKFDNLFQMLQGEIKEIKDNQVKMQQSIMNVCTNLKAKKPS